jgi:hypothetical protein
MIDPDTIVHVRRQWNDWRIGAVRLKDIRKPHSSAISGGVNAASPQPFIQWAIMAILTAIAKERGRAVVVVTHDPRLFGFADRTVYIEDGSLTREELPTPRMRSGILQRV